MSLLTIIGLLVMTLAGSLGAIYFKKVSGHIEISNPLSMLKNINLYIGGGFYLLGAVLNILLLKKLDYSIVYPMTSLTYVWTMFLSFFLFQEKINSKKVIAVVLIVAGAVIINL